MGRRPVDEHAAEIDADGYTILDEVAAPPLLDELRGAVDRLVGDGAVADGTARFRGGRTSRVSNLLAKADVFGTAVLSPPVLELMGRLLGEGFLVSSVSVAVVHPGESAQPVHSDDQAVRAPRRVDLPPFATAIWALDEFTSLNGATRVHPGTHRAESPCRWRSSVAAGLPDPVPAEMPAGSALVYHGGLYHGAGANTASTSRRALLVGYCAGSVRQVENQALAIPLERLASFPRRLQQLCGLEMYEGIVGHVEMRDPRDVLFGDRGA